MNKRADEVHAAVIQGLAPLLFGPRWGRDLARALEVDDRLVRRWRSGERPAPEWAARKVLDLAEEHHLGLTAQIQLARGLLTGVTPRRNTSAPLDTSGASATCTAPILRT